METRRPRILVVDDEELNREILVAALGPLYDIETAAGGYEAITKILRKMPDLVLLDVMMPDLDGFETCRNIKKDEAYAQLPIIFLSAMDTPADELKGLEAGGIDYLAKPVNIEIVRMRVRNHLELVCRSRIICDQRDQLARQKEELEKTLARVKLLEGIIPICMYCKQIRSDDEAWHQLEQYISDHSNAMFSHSICPSCFDKESARLRLR